MCRVASLSLCALLVLSCGDSDVIEGVTDECTLDPIVRARMVRGAIDCSPESASAGPIPYYIVAEQPPGDDAVIECIRDALGSRRDAVYLSQLIIGIDSMFRSAKLVSANGRASLLSYDSSPTGQGTGGNTVFLFNCAPFAVDPTLGCEGEGEGQLVCSQDPRVRATFR
jgi:hypothetical protein